MTIPGSLSQPVSSAKAPYVFRLEQDIADTVAAPLYKPGGVSLSLASGDTATLKFATHKAGGSGIKTINSSSLDASAETATFAFTATHVADPALYLGRITIKSSAGTAKSRVPVFVEVAPDILADNTDWPVTIDAVREKVMDRAAADNRVLDATEWEDGDIANALFAACDHWNEVAYPRLPMYTPTDCIYREQLMLAATGRCYLDKAQNLQRNRLPALGEGMKVDDYEHRIALYVDEGKRLWEMWQAFVMRTLRESQYSQWVGDSRNLYYS